MRIAMSLAVGLFVACCPIAAQAQVPHIVGNWELNVEASQLPGPAPQTEARTYFLTEDGVLIGIAVFVDAQGRAGFLQFAARPDGMDYPEFDTGSAAQYLIDGTEPVRTYAEIPTDDSHRVRWVDKANGQVIASGEKWVSEDGQTLFITVDGANERDEAVEPLYVYDRMAP